MSLYEHSTYSFQGEEETTAGPLDTFLSPPPAWYPGQQQHWPTIASVNQAHSPVRHINEAHHPNLTPWSADIAYQPIMPDFDDDEPLAKKEAYVSGFQVDQYSLGSPRATDNRSRFWKRFTIRRRSANRPTLPAWTNSTRHPSRTKLLAYAFIIACLITAPVLLVVGLATPAFRDLHNGNLTNHADPHPAQPTTTLFPAIHWDHNIYDVNNLIPQNSSAMYYAETPGMQDPYTGHQFLHMDVSFTYPTVMLEHCIYASLLQCTNSTATNATFTIGFENRDAYQVANQTWRNETDLVLVLFGTGCSNTNSSVAATQNYTRTYWMVQDMDFELDNPGFSTVEDGGNVTLTAFSVVYTEGLANGDLVWGTYTPSSTTVNATTDSSTPASTDGPGLPGFDLMLDNANGLTTIDTAASAGAINLLANITLLTVQAASEQSSSSPSSSASAWWNKVKQGLKSLADKVEHLVEAAFTATVDAVEFMAKVAWDEVDGKNATFSTTIANFTDQWALNLATANTTAPGAPWSNAVALVDKSDDTKTEDQSAGDDLKIYCVNCGFVGSLQVAGGASFDSSSGKGVTSLYANVSGYMNLGLQLGVVAGANNYYKLDDYIAIIPLAPLSIPDLISVGPIVTIKWELDLTVGSGGKMLAGTDIEIGPFSGSFDVMNNRSLSFGNMSTNVQHYFEAELDKPLNVSGTFSLPIELGIGVSFHNQPPYILGLIDTPAINISAVYVESDSTSSSKSESTKETCRDGIAWNIETYNNISLDMFHLQPDKDLAHTQLPFQWSGCYTSKDIAADNLTQVATQSVNGSSVGNYTGITDVNGTFALVSDPDGNVYATNNMASGSMWTVSTSTTFGYSMVFGDGEGRYLHYYSDELLAYNVSRMRLSAPDQWPSSAIMFGLLPAASDGSSDGSKPMNYIPLALEEGTPQYPYPIVCTMENARPRFFVGMNVNVTIAALTNPTLQGTVTGGNVLSCAYILLNSNTTIFG